MTLTAVSLSVMYHPGEDRLVCVAAGSDGGRLALMVTRRLAIRLVNGFARLLERTSAAALEAPARARGDIVMFEHQGALASAAGPAPASAAPAPEAPPAQAQMPTQLLDAIDVKVHPDRFALTLKSGAQELARMQVSRHDLHRLLALLRRKCDEAAWHVPIETGWLDLEAGSMTLN